MINNEQRDLVERFLNHFNLIESHLKKALNKDEHTPFINLIREYYEKNPRWSFKEDLKTFGYLRNSLVHTKIKPNGYIAIPTTETVEKIEKIYSELINPKKVIPEFSADVIQINLTDSIYDVLKIIKERNFSQFPVYDNSVFKGLLTENGITRWLANYVSENSEIVSLKDETIDKVIINEEKDKNFHFVSRTAKIDEVENIFAKNPFLEAIFITNSGKENEKLLGVITIWDLIW